MINFDNESYEVVRTRIINNLKSNVDKRETSMSSLSVSGVALEIHNVYEILKLIQDNAWILTCSGQYLDYKCLERGIIRKQPTSAIKMGNFNIYIGKDTEFSTIGLDNPLVYKTTENAVNEITYYLDRVEYTSGTTAEKINIGYFYDIDLDIFYKDGIEIVVEKVSELPTPTQEDLGKYYFDNNDSTLYICKENNIWKAKVECETPGTIGNAYASNVLPLVNNQNLKTAYIDELILSGTDIEDDLSLRTRFLASLDGDSFAGNISAYRNYALSISGVGAVQVYPHYKGPGTVKLSILDSNYETATPALVELVQNLLCPPEENDNEPSPLGFGMAPIGAKVDIGTATNLSIDLTFDATLTQGTEVADIQNKVEEVFENHLKIIRANWGNALVTNKVQYTVVVYISRVISDLLSIEEIVNISNLKLNNESTDIICIEDANYSETPSIDIQQLPIKGNVVITKV